MEVFGSRLFVGGEGAAGEGDHSSGLIGDGKHDAVAELCVKRRGSAVHGRLRSLWRIPRVCRRTWTVSRRLLLLLPRKQPARPHCLFVEVPTQGIAQEEPGFRGKADAETGNHFLVEAAAGQVFAGVSRFRAAQLVAKE